MRAKLLELILWIYCFLIGSKHLLFYKKEMKVATLRGDKAYRPSKRMCKRYKISFEDAFGMGTGYLRSKTSDSSITVFYLHGGAYTRPPMSIHWKFIAKLQEKTQATFIVPIYPKAPHHIVDESFEKLGALYETYCNEHPNQTIVIAGDSSGGGFVVAFAQYIRENNLKQPKRYLAFCPWLDITLSNPKIKSIERKDPVFSSEGLRYVGDKYKGNHHSKDWIVSPMYGSMKECSELILFAGTKDIFYPDITAFYRREKNHNALVKLHSFENQVHDFQLFPVRLTKKVIHITVNYILQ